MAKGLLHDDIEGKNWLNSNNKKNNNNNNNNNNNKYLRKSRVV